MGKLSLNRKKGAESEESRGGQRKITGFFPAPSSSSFSAGAVSSVDGARPSSSAAATVLAKIVGRSVAEEAENNQPAGGLLGPSFR